MLDLGSCMFPFSLFQVGVGKSILQTLLGFFMFGGVTFHPVNVIGHVMNIMGGIGYTLLKYYCPQSFSGGGLYSRGNVLLLL